MASSIKTLNSNVCAYFNEIYILFRGDLLETVDVLCYRDYTREGKRVNGHSLVIKDVKMPNFKEMTGKDSPPLCVCVCVSS